MFANRAVSPNHSHRFGRMLEIGWKKERLDPELKMITGADEFIDSIAAGTTPRVWPSRPEDRKRSGSPLKPWLTSQEAGPSLPTNTPNSKITYIWTES